MDTITFDKSAKLDILNAFGLTVDGEGYLVEKSNPEQRVLAPDGSEVILQEFGGFQRGSLLVVKSDISSLLELIDRLK